MWGGGVEKCFLHISWGRLFSLICSSSWLVLVSFGFLFFFARNIWQKLCGYVFKGSILEEGGILLWSPHARGPPPPSLPHYLSLSLSLTHTQHPTDRSVTIHDSVQQWKSSIWIRKPTLKSINSDVTRAVTPPAPIVSQSESTIATTSRPLKFDCIFFFLYYTDRLKLSLANLFFFSSPPAFQMSLHKDELGNTLKLPPF